ISKREELQIIEEIPIAFIKEKKNFISEGVDDNSKMVFESILTPLFDGNSQFWGCIKLSRNISQKRYLEDKLTKFIDTHSIISREDKEKLENYFQKKDDVQQQLIHSEKLLSLGKISAGISHEIYNSLSVLSPKIKMFGNYLDKILNLLEEYKKLHQIASPPDLAEQLDKILKISKTDKGIDYYTSKLQKFIAPCTSELYSIEKIVEGLNEFTNLQKSEFRDININDELENTLILLEYEFSNNNIKVIKRYDSTLTNVSCFPADLNQVIINILTNSIESLKEKASQKIDFDPLIKITTIKEDEYVIINIFDNGIGFPKDFQDNIFDPFFTTKSPTTNPGLGLSTVINVIEKKHKGSVKSHTEPGEFVEFIIKFPLSLKETTFQ
ncbi:GHKL domain-containing protein, partial [bacterium]|nr:GHKL domain-containing protein [bacterium]